MSENLFQEEQPVSEDMLVKLSESCDRLRKLEKEVEEAEDVLKHKQRELENVSRDTIPSLLNSLGLSELRLSTGEKIEIKDKVKASIANKNYFEAYRNMVEAEGGDEEAEKKVNGLFKSTAVLEDPSDEVLDFLLDKEIAYESKKSIHAQTLAKYCRGKLERGEFIPEGISVFSYQETKIK